MTTTEPTYPQYTNLGLKQGLFDQLMLSVNSHIEKQYKQGRLHGSDYAQVYVGSINAAMVNTTQYLLGVMLLQEQQAKLKADTLLTEKQLEKVDAEVLMVELERLRLKFQIEELMPLEKLMVEAQLVKIQQEGLLITAQISKIEAEIAFLDAQEAMMQAQATKIGQEVILLGWKSKTEEANTVSGVADSDSLVGRQMSLLEAQKLGFAADVQNKCAKMHADYDSVFLSVMEPEGPDTAELGDSASDIILVSLSTAADIASA